MKNLIFCMIIGLLTFSCGKSKVSVPLNDESRLKVGEISISVPEGWKRVASQKGYECVLKSDAAIENYDLSGIFSVRKVPLKTGQTLVNFQDKMQKLLYSKMMKDNSALSSSGIKDRVITQDDITFMLVDLNGREVLRIDSVSVIKVKEKLKFFKNVQHVIQTKENFYIVAAGSSEDSQNTIKPLADKFINSIVVVN